ncbi:MAG: hypothetical protein U0U46_11465 [Saprospiraceae bacterium]
MHSRRRSTATFAEFTVRFRAEKAGKLSEMPQLSSRITRAELLQCQRSEPVALRFSGNTIAGVGFELYQNQPNPWVGRTMVGFHLPVAATATLTVYDETGRVLFTQKGDFAKGRLAGSRHAEHDGRAVLQTGNGYGQRYEEDDSDQIRLALNKSRGPGEFSSGPLFI